MREFPEGEHPDQKELEMLNDEIIDEVRVIREAYAAKFNFDLRAIFKDLKKSEAEHLAGGRSFVEPPNTSIRPDPALRQTRFAKVGLTEDLPELRGQAVRPADFRQ